MMKVGEKQKTRADAQEMKRYQGRERHMFSFGFLFMRSRDRQESSPHSCLGYGTVENIALLGRAVNKSGPIAYLTSSAELC
jgi:hypothetical protein